MGTVIVQREITVDQGFDLNRGFSAPDVRVMAVAELRNHRLIHIGFNTCIGKELKAERNRMWGVAGLDQIGDAMVAHVDIEKLIHIGDQHPVRIAHSRLLAGGYQRFHLVVAPLSRVGEMGDTAALRQRVQQVIGAIAAVIRVKQEIGDTNQPMISDPFQ